MKTLPMPHAEALHRFFPLPRWKGQIPTAPHPGAFGVQRRYHIHEGIDLYSELDTPVYAIAGGTVVGVYQFTGEAVGMPWWNDTYAIAIADTEGTWVYGEIQEPQGVAVGDYVHPGYCIGRLARVLKETDGRPTTMLHLERWKPNFVPYTFIWDLQQPQPDFIVDPTDLLLQIQDK